MKAIRVLFYIGIFIILLGFEVNGKKSKKDAEDLSNCRRLDEECDEKDHKKQCCPIGTCIKGICSSGIFPQKVTRGIGGVDDDAPVDKYAQAEAIARELETLTQVDVRKHKNLKLLPSLKHCGYSSKKAKNGLLRKKRIVGGDAVELGAYPWVVQLYLHNITWGSNYFHCGGTIINSRHILTAAHCLTRIPTAQTLRAVTIGTTDRRQTIQCLNDNSTCSAAFQYEIEEKIVHENYSEGNVRHDIGLIRLSRDINFTDFARPICLPLSEDMFRRFDSGSITVVGWGTQNKAQDGTPKVISWKEQQVQNNLVTRDTCNRFFSRITGKLQRSQICAGGYPGRGDCGGDSGGPLFKKLPIPDVDWESPNITEDNKRYYQFGIVSTGSVTECGKQGRPSVYTSVMYYMPWILDNLSPNSKLSVCENCSSIDKKVNPKEEIATGLDINLLDNPNADLLPKFPQCGPPPQILPNVISSISNAGEPVLKRVKRVIGGRPFGVGSLSWMVQIYVRNSVTLNLELRCSGFIISSRYVMTAAHCVTEISAPYSLDSIVVGNYNRLKNKECIGNECIEKKFISIEDVIVHEHYAKYTHENDIALIRLPEEIKFGRFIQPICLPLTEELLNNWTDNKFTTAGWGKVTNSDSPEFETSNILHAANITLQSRSNCDYIYTRQTGLLENSRICGGGDPGKGECTGDSGGPMMRWLNPDNSTTKRYYAFGIASFVECGEQGSPGIYTNILYHMPWVLSKLEP